MYKYEHKFCIILLSLQNTVVFLKIAHYKLWIQLNLACLGREWQTISDSEASTWDFSDSHRQTWSEGRNYRSDCAGKFYRLPSIPNSFKKSH